VQARGERLSFIEFQMDLTSTDLRYLRIKTLGYKDI